MNKNNLKLSSIIEPKSKQRKPLKVIISEEQMKNLVQNIKNEREKGKTSQE